MARTAQRRDIALDLPDPKRLNRREPVVGAAPEPEIFRGGGAALRKGSDVIVLERVTGLAAAAGFGVDVTASTSVALPDLALHFRCRPPLLLRPRFHFRRRKWRFFVGERVLGSFRAMLLERKRESVLEEIGEACAWYLMSEEAFQLLELSTRSLSRHESES